MAKTPKANDINVDDLARKIARQRSLSEPIGEALGQSIYRMNEGWETSILKGDPDVTVVMSVAELDKAMNEPSVAAIVIPKKAAVTTEKMYAVVERSSLVKTIFVEG